MLSKLKTALRALLRKSQAERELDEGLRYHIEQQTEQNIRLGMSPEEARCAALKVFCGVEQAKERSRDARGVRWLEELWQDLRFGARMLLNKPGFTLIGVITLGLGVGANTVIFSFFFGLPGGLLLTRLMKTLLFGVSATDPLTFVGVSLLLFSVAMLACYLPARKAAQVDPLVALRCD